jgi:hypothetical protein
MSGEAYLDEGSVYCERSDLPMNMCGHCRNLEEWNRQFAAEKRARARVRKPSLLGKWFAASYPGECSRCETPFKAGDEIRGDYPEGSGYIAKQCHPNARARPVAA